MALSIEKTKLLAVEGKDECNFFIRLLELLAITDVQVLDVGGKDKFLEKFVALTKVAGFNQLESIGIVRDAEDQSANIAFGQVKTVLVKVDLPEPTILGQYTVDQPNVGVFIMPNNNSSGMLEDLCLSSISGTPLMTCIDIFFGCIPDIPTNISKAKMLCFMSSKSPIMNSLGLCALNGHLDLTHTNFDSIKAFVTNL